MTTCAEVLKEILGTPSNPDSFVSKVMSRKSYKTAEEVLPIADEVLLTAYQVIKENSS